MSGLVLQMNDIRIVLCEYALIGLGQFLRGHRHQRIHLGIHDAGEGQIDEEHAERDGQQQQGLEALLDREIDQHTGDADHNQVFPAAVFKIAQPREAGFLPELDNGVPQFTHPGQSFR